MDIERCCFAGHNEIYGDEVKQKIKDIAIKLIEEESVIEFWVGTTEVLIGVLHRQ